MSRQHLHQRKQIENTASRECSFSNDKCTHANFENLTKETLVLLLTKENKLFALLTNHSFS